MVHLVLDDARRQPLGLDLALLAGLLLRAHAYAQETLDIDVYAGQAEAPLFADLGLLAGPLQHGVHQRYHGVFRIGPVDEHAMQNPQLGGCQAHPQRVVHELAHARDLLLQRLIEAVDRHGAGAQDGIAELAH